MVAFGVEESLFPHFIKTFFTLSLVYNKLLFSVKRGSTVFPLFSAIFTQIDGCAGISLKKKNSLHVSNLRHELDVKAANCSFVYVVDVHQWCGHLTAISHQNMLMFYLLCCSDLENYLIDGLKAENLSKKAKEKREAFIKRIKEVKQGYDS